MLEFIRTSVFNYAAMLLCQNLIDNPQAHIDYLKLIVQTGTNQALSTAGGNIRTPVKREKVSKQHLSKP